ncbi:esterase, partial [Yersinia pestis]|nr:esterase [Yersinia pestis]
MWITIAPFVTLTTIFFNHGYTSSNEV